MRFVLPIIFLVTSVLTSAQSNDCKLKIGTNLSGISDWMTEMPFVDRMHNARTWGTRNATGWEGEWNTDLAGLIAKDENGYPLEVPFYIDGIGLEDSQIVFTVWAILDAWEPGIYTFLYDGEGRVEFEADGKIIRSEPGRLEVEIIPTDYSFLELKIMQSKKGNHLRNFRLITPGNEATYYQQHFNPLFLERLKDFSAIRFMDWGSTNNWGENEAWDNYNESTDTLLVPWNERSKMNYYTWAHNKGVPYEIMCDLCNTLNKDMWICVPHNASDEYISEMAGLIKGRLYPNLKVYAEYSNEIWNWMFGQTQWLNTFFCTGRGISWPEGIVDHVQNNLDIWNQIFADEPDRLVTVAGGQTAWQDVTNRIVTNLDKGSFDALNITGYFGLGDDASLDALGAEATAANIALQVRTNMREEEISYIENQHKLAKKLGVPLVFYESGQHITPTPFGEEPTYAQALLDIQRDSALYNIYHEWFSMIENVLDTDEQAVYMNFSFVGDRSARYGSWGVLETLNQDTSVIYAPKYQALTEQIRFCGKPGGNTGNIETDEPYLNPFQILKHNNNSYTMLSKKPVHSLYIYSLEGKKVKVFDLNNAMHYDFDLSTLSKGFYLANIKGNGFEKKRKLQVD